MQKLEVIVTERDTAPPYKLFLDGTFDGKRGSIEEGGTYKVEQIRLDSGGKTVLRAVLAQPVEMPAALITKTDPARLRKFEDDLKPEIDALLAAQKKDAVARFRALRDEALRRLRNVEIDWKGAASAKGTFLSTAEGTLEARGEAKLALAFLVSEDQSNVAGAALAEFRATIDLTASVTVDDGSGPKTASIARSYGMVCRIGAAGAAPVTLGIDFDDINLSLPEIELPKLDLSTFTHAKIPAVDLARSPLAGAFSRFLEGLTVVHTWDADPELAVMYSGGELLFAVMKSGLADDAYDLSQYNSANPPQLATLTATVTKDALTLTAADVTLARYPGVVTATATLSATGTIALTDDRHKLGPLTVVWEGVSVTGVFEASDASLRARVKFERLIVFPTDDPAAVLALSGEVEITQSGTRIVALSLVEPYPVELVARAGKALLRGAQKIVELLGTLSPPGGDASKLKQLLEVLGKIASALARAAVLVGEVLAEAAELLARALVKVAELVGALLAKLAEALSKISPLPTLDIEIRIGLDPLELRQVMITPRSTGLNGGMKDLSALGLTLQIPAGWRPALLLDFVTQPGAYLLAVRPDASNTPFASISTDLWLKRPAGTVAPVRDAADDGERGAKPLIALEVKRRNAQQPLMLLVAGVSRGEALFFRYAGDPVRRKVNPVAIPLAGGGQADVLVLDGPFTFLPLGPDLFEVSLNFEKDRVLSLLGMGEPGKDASASTGFLARLQQSLAQVVWVEKVGTPTLASADGRTVVSADVLLGIKAAGITTHVALGFSINDALEVSFTGGDALPLRSRRIEERALGLTWVVEQRDPTKLKNNEEVVMFNLAFSGGESGFALNKQEARMELRFDGLSSDGQGLVFDVETFSIGRGGLDLVATVRDRAVRLNGIDVPFRFNSGRLEIRGGRFEGALITARGQLPPDLVGEADCTAAFRFESQNGEIVLQGATVELEKRGDPIVCHSTRFTLTITDLDIGLVRDNGYHFYFLVTGSLRFTPKTGEFEDGLLQHLADVEISLERTPLTADPRVLVNHIAFQKALNPKKTFSLFNIFTFELRGFGFHPASPKFEGRPPAVNLSGQIRFAEIGDVMQPKIDFHGLWIAPPKSGESLPRIKADGLGVDLQLAGAVNIRGAVLAVDPDTRTVEGGRFAPEGYDTYGFLGEGMLDIPGWGMMEASLGFLEVEKKDRPGERKKAFFLFLQKNKLAIEIPTPIWTFYLREAGFGFGYRYTLAGIAAADKAKSVAELVKTLDDVSRRQGDLARFTAWTPDPDKDNFTLAMRAAFQPMPAQKQYDQKAEEQAVSPFFFDIVAALRSDFTFLMSARGWLGVNYATFLANKDNFRENPGFRGFLYISAPRSELLLRAVASSTGFVGNDFPLVAEGQILRKAVQSVDWSTTLYIRPGLFHYEMGWPDQLVVRLVDQPNMRVLVRGGMIFRAAEEGLLLGYNIGAEAFLRFEGRAGGSIGVALVAELSATFVARVLAFISSNFRGSLVYGLVSLDARLTFSVEAWMEVDLGFTSFTLRIGFSFSVQFTAAIELAISDSGVGGRVAARIAVQVFGCSLGVGIGFSFNDAQLDAARARVERFLALSITAEEPDSPPVFAAKTGDKAITETAKSAEAVKKAPPPAPSEPNADPKLKPSVKKSGFGRGRPGPTDFFLALRKASAGPGGTPLPPDKVFAYGLFVPREATDPAKGGFYAVPRRLEPAHAFETTGDFSRVLMFDPHERRFVPFRNGTITPRWDAPIAVPGGKKDTFTLGHFFDECFLADTAWETEQKRVASNWCEPKTLRVHQTIEPLTGSTEARKEERERHQRAQRADAVQSPHDERAYQARATLMTMFVDQFVALAGTGRPPDTTFDGEHEAHVTDLGLVVFGEVSDLLRFGGETLFKSQEKLPEEETQPPPLPGDIHVFNPPSTWFDAQDPVLADDRAAVDTDGIKLDWRLVLPQGGDADHFLDHYDVLRTIEGFELTQQHILVKPAATVGAREERENNTPGDRIFLVPPDWQFVDALTEDTGVTPAMRRALLPTYGEADAVKAAEAWLEVFRGEEVTVTYSVTPVDVAGVRGLPRSFTVDIRRPQPPIRPAVGEVRIVQTIKPGATATASSEDVPTDLEVFLALSDRAWPRPAKEVQEIAGVKYEVARVYRLIVDREELEPAGHYGSNASTSRLRGPGAFAPKRTADEQKFDVSRAEMNLSPEVIARIEPDADERKNLPLWADLTKRDGLLPLLWKRGDARVATRFFLETLVVFTPPKSVGLPIEHVSRRVVLPVEHVVVEHPAVENPAATLRPEAFEWAVPLPLPPLGEGQVQAESGFARFRVPKVGARLGDLTGGGERALSVVRDAERRVLTSVRFAAVPDWAGETAVAKKPHPLHGTSIANFDLYELDLDDLAPLDVDVTEPRKDLALDAKAWSRARRVARIEHLSREDARLVPAGNADWQGWQAHYPSETQRLVNARKAPRGESKPIRAAWYSDRESTPHFVERRPRLRLLPSVPETVIAELMRGGRPDKIVASLLVPTGLTDPLPKLRAHAVTVDGVALMQFPPTLHGDGSCSFGKSSQFDAKDIRNLLLCLGWTRFTSGDPLLVKWLADPAALDGLKLVVQGTFGAHPTGRVELPLDFRSPLHPLLEEVVAELALATRGEGAVYRRYTVMPQAVTPFTAKDVAGFMAGTAPEADPYGWQILQILGHATTIRLYDAAEERFLNPELLRDRVNAAFQSALTRWRDAYGEEVAPVVGQPFAEVFFRPGADRLAGPFDAVLKNDTEAEPPPPLELDDDGLAFVQLSLRPRPAAAWVYMQHDVAMKEKEGHRLRRSAVRVAATAPLDVARARGGAIAEVASGKSSLVPIPPGAAGEELTLFFRLPNGVEESQKPALALVLEWEKIDDGATVAETAPIALTDANWKRVSGPASPDAADPFARFQALTPEVWTAALGGGNAVATGAFGSFRDALLAALPAGFSFTKAGDLGTVVAPYLTWSQRFLDHAAAFEGNAAPRNEPFLALAAPTKASPWKLASDSEGYLTLTFLHSDRWAHARAYAVKPIGRYHEVLSGIGIEAEEKAETFDDVLTSRIGYAVAVSPRTERIEPPVLVHSRIATHGGEPVTEIVVARHGEEALAASNRPLLARLGLPTSLLAFSRAYRTPEWPKRLQAAFDPIGSAPSAILHPTRAAAVPETEADTQHIDDVVIRGIAKDYPSLWKGADVWHVAPLPPQYRLLAFASERAGVVVSNVASVVLDEQPRRPLREDGFPGPPKLTFVREDGVVRMRLEHRLVSYDALTTARAKSWNGHGGEEDICWWPDPDVVYVLLRRRKAADGTVVTEEEDAETRLVAKAEGGSNEPAEQRPIVVRARGPRYRVTEADGRQRVTIATAAGGGKRTFDIAMLFELRTPPPIDSVGLTPEESGGTADIARFNELAATFAAIVVPHELTLDLAAGGDTAAQYAARLAPLRDVLDRAAGDLVEEAKDERWLDGTLAAELRAAVAAIDAAVAANPATADELRTKAKLPLRIVTPWRPRAELPPELAAVVGFRSLAPGAGVPPARLVVWDLADDTERKTLARDCDAPVAKEGGRFQRVLARRIAGESSGFWMQAIDTRTRMEIDPTSGDPIGTPGVADIAIDVPWIAAAVKEGGVL